jgi:phage baseplate assembly protein W
MTRNYTQPLTLGIVTKGEEHPKCGLQQSIAQRIHLILITNFKEFRYDQTFGCLIWEHDFENMPNVTAWKDRMSKATKEVIQKFETRLINHQVQIDITEEEFKTKDNTSIKRIKRRVDVIIKGNIKKTNEQFYFKEVMYVSPVWVN